MKIIKFVICIYFIISSNMQAQVVYIPDINFKTKLLTSNAINIQGQSAPIDTNQNGEIEVSEAQNVSILGPNFVNANISDLTGLEYFINIKAINLSTNQISQFNFPTLNLLEFLYLAFNPISSFNVSNHPNLKQLYTHDTQISELNFEYSHHFVDLGAGNQPLTAINISNNPNLILLRIQNTNISSINIKNTNINFNHAGMLLDCWANIPLTYVCCDAEDVPALTTFLTNCGHNLANITIDTTQTCALSSGAIKNYNLAVYPNPSTGIFNITLPAVFHGQVEVFNTLGQKVYDANFENEQNMTLDLSALQKGLYVLKVVNAAGERFEEKVIIN